MFPHFLWKRSDLQTGYYRSSETLRFAWDFRSINSETFGKIQDPRTKSIKGQEDPRSNQFPSILRLRRFLRMIVNLEHSWEMFRAGSRGILTKNHRRQFLRMNRSSDRSGRSAASRVAGKPRFEFEKCDLSAIHSEQSDRWNSEGAVYNWKMSRALTSPIISTCSRSDHGMTRSRERVWKHSIPSPMSPRCFPSIRLLRAAPRWSPSSLREHDFLPIGFFHSNLEDLLETNRFLFSSTFLRERRAAIAAFNNRLTRSN